MQKLSVSDEVIISDLRLGSADRLLLSSLGSVIATDYHFLPFLLTALLATEGTHNYLRAVDSGKWKWVLWEL